MSMVHNEESGLRNIDSDGDILRLRVTEERSA